MLSQQPHRFIVIDDVAMNNHICQLYIMALYPAAQIKTFTDPKAGLEYIKQNDTATVADKTIIFLDIHMPVLTGWDVLERFKSFPDTVKEKFIIYIHSSTMDGEDRERAKNDALIAGFIEKPLTMIHLHATLSALNK